MSPSLNRTAIILNLVAFVCCCLFCIATQAPLIQQDILKRSQDALLIHHIPIRGLAVDGRDVIVSEFPDSAFADARAERLLENVAGVRNVKTRLAPGTSSHSVSDPTQNGAESSSSLEPATKSQQMDVQAKIDRLLNAQAITFKNDRAALTPESEHMLDSVIVFLAETPNLNCEIRGYDTQPREAKQNWVLALQRALATEDYLETKGIPEWRLSAHAFQVGDGTEGRRTDRIIDLVVKAR